MQGYFDHLRSSHVPLPFWAVVSIWVMFFAGAQILFRRSGMLAEAQNHLITESTSDLIRRQSWRLVILQTLMTAFVFGYACFFGGAVFTFFAGGWLVTT